MKASEYLQIDENISIERKAKSNWPVPHYHNAFEMQYFLSGEVSFFVHDRTYNVRKGDVLFINSYEMHNLAKLNCQYDKVLLMYRPAITESIPSFKVPDILALLDMKFNGCRLVSLPVTLQPRVERILGDMLEIDTGHSKYKMTFLHQYLSLFFTYVADYLETADVKNDPLYQPNQKLRNIISFISNNLDKQLSLEELSGQFNYNKNYLCKFFKEQTGLTLNDYINRKRIITAEKLITQNKHILTDIALMVGFNSLTHFERTFKRFTGSSPRGYKAAAIKGGNGSE